MRRLGRNGQSDVVSFGDRRRGTQAKESRGSLEAGKGKKSKTTNSPLKPKPKPNQKTADALILG